MEVPDQDLSEKGSILAGSQSPWDKAASMEAAETVMPKHIHAVSKAKVWRRTEMLPDSQAPKPAERSGYNRRDILVEAGTTEKLLQPSSGSPASQSLLLEVAILQQFPWKPETDGYGDELEDGRARGVDLCESHGVQQSQVKGPALGSG